MIPRYISMAELSDRLPFSTVHIRRLIARGEFPKPVKLGERRTAFNEDEVREWLDRKIAETA